MNGACELYLRLAAGYIGSLTELESMVAAARPSAILIGGIGPETDAASLRAFTKAAQRLDLAVLIEKELRLAIELDADGVHLRAGSADIAEMRRLLGAEKTIGMSCVLSRHDAMSMAEGGADYVAFGEFGVPGEDGPEAVAEMVEWWAELFEVPCVAWAQDNDGERELTMFAEAKADFLCFPAGGGSAAEIAARLAMIGNFTAPPRGYKSPA
jgi:thiamine-phosphate pyrophosphorylase